MRNKKIDFKTQKAFTLIELLIVIAIIGILAEVVLVSTGSSRNKANDAAIMASANSMMKAAQVDSMASGDYSTLTGSGWAVSTWFPEVSCDALPEKARAACNDIIKKTSPDTYLDVAGYNSGYRLYIGSSGQPNNPKLTILVALPGEKKFFCIGSNGRTSKITNLDRTGPASCPAGVWTCPGCFNDPSGGGS